MRFRVASAGAGGTIEVRTGSPTGTLVGTTETITPTGGWQTFKDVQLNLTNPPTGTNELFLVFRNRGSTQNLFNVNWIEFVGKGAAQTASPELAITATPATGGTAPQAVKFDATATDADGGTLTYAWDFGVPGTTTDVSTAEDPTYTYAAAGTYTVTLTVSDGQGGTTTKTALGHGQRARRAASTATRTTSTAATSAAGWEVIRRDQTLTVADGVLTIPAAGRRRLPDGQQRQEHRPAHGPGRRLDVHHEAQLQGPGAVPAGRHHGLRRRRQLHEVRSRLHQRRHRDARSRSSSSSTRSRARRATPPRTRRATSPPPSATTCSCASSPTAPTSPVSTRSTARRGPRSAAAPCCRPTPRSASSPSRTRRRRSSTPSSTT